MGDFTNQDTLADMSEFDISFASQAANVLQYYQAGQKDFSYFFQLFLPLDSTHIMK